VHWQKSSKYEFFTHFFYIKFSGSQTFFEKLLAPFSRKISTFLYFGSIITYYCGVKLNVVKISAQLLKSPVFIVTAHFYDAIS
jgi:hypothetical protein